MNVAVTPPAYIAYMRSDLIALEKFFNFAKKNVNLLPGQPDDHQEILHSFPESPSIQSLRCMDEAAITRRYRQYESMIVHFRSLFKNFLHNNNNNSPLWMRKWCEVEPPHSFEFANDYVPVEAMRTKLIHYNALKASFQRIMPNYPSVEQLRQANPDEVRNYYDILNHIINQATCKH